MKGLLLKDFYMGLRYGGMFFVVALVFLVASIWGNNNSFFLLYPMLLIGMFPITLISYDERSHWNSYSDAFPYSRSKIVSEKYLLMLLATGAFVLLTGIAQIIRMSLAGGMDWSGLGSTLGILVVFGLLSTGVMFPVVFKFGSEKGRFVYMIVIVVFCLLVSELNKISKQIVLPFNGSEPFLVPAAMAASLLVFAASWRLSVFFYKKREM